MIVFVFREPRQLKIGNKTMIEEHLGEANPTALKSLVGLDGCRPLYLQRIDCIYHKDSYSVR